VDIIQRNFFRLLRSGAYHDQDDIEPMSAFKWKRLYQLVDAQQVAQTTYEGIKNHANDPNLQLPEELKNQWQQEAEMTRQQSIISSPLATFELSNYFLNRRLKGIMNAERHSIDCSGDTMNLLNIIIYNVNHILSRGINLHGIIELGKYLRKNGHKVDFVKLDTWLRKLGMQRMAQLEGSILMAVFNFQQEELPFVEHPEPAAYKLTLRTLSHTAKDTAEEWHFRQYSNGFVQNNSKVLRRNLRRSIRYFTYYPVETTSNFFSNFVKSLSEIEE